MVPISRAYTKDCYHKRTRHMVDAADAVLAFYNGSGSGGTAYTVKYTHRQGKEIVIINPLTPDRTVIPAKTNV